jgi:predicted nucleotidyltransferase
VETAVEAYVRDILRRNRGIETVIWFGSWIHGNPVPGSDVDICLILSRSTKRFRDRIPDFLPGAFPTGLDLFPYTKKEFTGLAERHPGWHRAILSGRIYHATRRKCEA